MIKKTFLCILLMFSFIIFQGFNKDSVKTNASTKQEITASKAIVIDSYSGRILYEKNSNDTAYMASTTKILTAITVIDNCDVTKKVAITKDMVGIEGSSIYLEEGEILSVKDLLYGLMLRSGNDCAVALSIACSGTTDNFVKLMNDLAKKIGAKNSNFVNPHGLHDDSHYTTACDLVLITQYALKNQIFAEIVSTKSIKIPFTTRNTYRLLKNKNKLLANFEGCTGVKTGFTKKAGRCLVTSCNRGDLSLICVVLNSPSMWEDSKYLLNSAFGNYNNCLIASKDNVYDFVKVENSNQECGVYIKNDVKLPLTINEQNDITINNEYPNIIPKGTKKDTNIGNIEIYIKNNLIFTEKIYTIIDV